MLVCAGFSLVPSHSLPFQGLLEVCPKGFRQQRTTLTRLKPFSTSRDSLFSQFAGHGLGGMWGVSLTTGKVELAHGHWLLLPSAITCSELVTALWRLLAVPRAGPQELQVRSHEGRDLFGCAWHGCWETLETCLLVVV